jgi:hypothetical protein
LGVKLVVLLVVGWIFSSFGTCCGTARVDHIVELQFTMKTRLSMSAECSVHHATRHVARYGSQRHNVAEACESQSIKVRPGSPFGQLWVSGSAVKNAQQST